MSLPLFSFSVFAQQGSFQTGLDNNIYSQLDYFSQTATYAQSDLEQFVVITIFFALAWSGIVFVALVFYGGYLWFLGGGNADLVTKAQSVLKSAVTGLLIVLIGYSITVSILRAAYNIFLNDSGQYKGQYQETY